MILKVLKIDPTDDAMKSAFGMVNYRMNLYPTESKQAILSDYIDAIVNKTYINHWQSIPRLALQQAKFLNDTLPLLRIIAQD